jgi:hypothetical protein
MMPRPSLCTIRHRFPFGQLAVPGRSGRLNRLEMGAFRPPRVMNAPTFGGRCSSHSPTSHRRRVPDRTTAPTVSALSP